MRAPFTRPPATGSSAAIESTDAPCGCFRLTFAKRNAPGGGHPGKKQRERDEQSNDAQIGERELVTVLQMSREVPAGEAVNLATHR